MREDGLSSATFGTNLRPPIKPGFVATTSRCADPCVGFLLRCYSDPVMYTLIGTAKLNDIDPQAWLADVLDRIAEHPISRLHQLLPWKWRPAAATLNSNAA